jgi:dipeptidyl aminopeptidase/acylaminoacyl peptidase
MTLNDGFDRTVADWLDEEAGRGSPGYLDEVLTRTTRTRQRPWWSSPERWLPVQSTARFAQVPRMAWLLVVLGLVVALGTAILVAGSPRRPPSPFGPAAQGNVLYAAADGDIYAIDAATNVARPLVTGPAADSDPLISPDGTSFAFVRRDAGSLSTSIVLANADGSGLREITGLPEEVAGMALSPDGTKLAVVGSQGLWMVGPDMSPTLVTPTTSSEAGYDFFESPQWRPNGDELIFLSSSLALALHSGVFVVHTDGSGLRALVEMTIAAPAQPALSPDGTRVVYSILGTDQREIHVVDVQTGLDHRVAFDGAVADVRPQWSPDGTKLVFERTLGEGFQLMVGSVNGGPVIAIGPTRPDKSGGAEVRFSPDGTKILAFYNADRTTWVLDPTGGPGTKLAYDAVTPPSWQRAAP